MKSRVRLLQTAFYIPVIMGVLRLIITAIILVLNPQNLRLPFFQLIPAAVIVVTLFFYLKMYTDGIPIITLIVPDIVHFLIVLVFTGKVDIIPFVAPVASDILFLVVKGLKASMFPFEIEGKENDLDGFTEFDELNT